ncbi:Blp family class II bacteriocin [Streptococcus agalactiae]|uniref:Blp family class II bacteriocin n=1 Tax=Streptococcus agalactiae TaxID=1311 RepID=UPI00137497DF|nr:Blp family class II bacteriocin [Streptococcus agalactiae]KAF1126316.1 bacteriocin BlpN [Streptococcus agalactiae]MCC9988629.1 bacteriocin BlpN [Streptococcus agalactiae]MCD0020360.1 bacteriocin BlpN [Streptococcus agalactiae]HEN0625669.1 Blp family class II bacteriocin [Streptococcus agalactiae]HEN9894175.1 Blp family class II bacteriocin [Streptococcus agalactiae]
MSNYKILDEGILQKIEGGNPASAAVVAGMGCAATGIKYGSKLGVWGAGIGGAVVCGYLAYTAVG